MLTNPQTIENIRYGWLKGKEIDLYEKWSGHLGVAVFVMIGIGLAYMQFRLFQHGL